MIMEFPWGVRIVKDHKQKWNVKLESWENQVKFLHLDQPVWGFLEEGPELIRDMEGFLKVKDVM